MKQAFIALMLLVPVFSTGCSTYTLKTITASEARSNYLAGVTYRVGHPHAVLVRSISVAWGFGQPDLELTSIEGRSAIAPVPVNTTIKIDRYVQYEQHGLYDCGSDGWRFAIGHVAEGRFVDTRFLIDLIDLDAILNPKQNVSPGGD
jgi:hypothetical protein